MTDEGRPQVEWPWSRQNALPIIPKEQVSVHRGLATIWWVEEQDAIVC